MGAGHCTAVVGRRLKSWTRSPNSRVTCSVKQSAEQFDILPSVRQKTSFAPVLDRELKLKRPATEESNEFESRISANRDEPEPHLTTRSNSVEAWLLWVAAAVALAYLLLQRPYAGDVALKTSMCVLLAIAAFRSNMKLFALALLFSAAGDAFLAYDGERLFVPGLASFLVTHVLYAIVFVLATKDTATTPMSAGRKVTFAVIPTFAVAYSAVLWPNLGALAIPVMVYIAAIVVMAMLSLRVRPIEVPLGAMLFMVSDSLIALEKFMWQAAWVGPLVWITYALAQLLITRGMLTSTREPLRPGAEVHA